MIDNGQNELMAKNPYAKRDMSLRSVGRSGNLAARGAKERNLPRPPLRTAAREEAAPPPTPTLTLSGAAPDGAVGSAFSYDYTCDGAGPHTVQVVSGTLPAGLSFNGLTLEGDPLQEEFRSFTIRATDSLGAFSNDLADSIVINAAPAVEQTHWYRFENDLSDSGTAGVAIVESGTGGSTFNTVDFKEGVASVDVPLTTQLNIPDSAALQFGTGDKWTFGGFVKITGAINGFSTMVDRLGGNTRIQATDANRLDITIGGVRQNGCVSPVALNVWYHLVAVYDGAEPTDKVKYYVDGGAPVFTKSDTASQAAGADLRLCANESGSNNQGYRWDDFRVYDGKALTQAEVQAWFDGVG